MNNPIGVIFSNNDVSDRAVGRISSILTQNYPQVLSGNEQLAKLLTILRSASQTTKTASEQMAKLVSRLRNFVRLDESEWQTTDINEAIDNAIALMEMECPGRIKITKEYADLPGILCSPGSLNEAFVSLLRNACEAIDEEGEIKVITSVHEEYVKIEISDTGRGISSENLNRIFDPGFTTKGVDVGVGLGLPVCHKIIVDDHKGRILVSSKLGEGTTFTILLPLS
jgi:signal transduction histidine kinase